MRSLFTVFLLFAQSVIAQEWPLIRANTLSEVLNVGIRLGAEVSYRSSGSETWSRNTYPVDQYLGLDYQAGRWLGTDSSSPPGAGLNEGAIVNASSIEVGSGGSYIVGNWVVGLSGFVWGYDVVFFEDRPPVIAEGLQTNFAPGRTNLLFGFKLFEDGNPDIAYYGWVELLRDRGDAVSKFRFGRHAVDYLPNRGIRAGREPERPALVSVVTPESTTLSWDPLYAAHGFVLERTGSLTPPVVWEPVETPPGATNVVISNTPYSSALFRLARP
jgi:hypothetical protein